MSTCIGYEYRLKQQFPTVLGRLRVCSPERMTIVCYAEDTQGELNESLKAELETWFERYGLAGFGRKVKPYSELEADGVPPRMEIPVYIQHYATFGQINMTGVYESISKAFPSIGTFKMLDCVPGPGDVSVEISKNVEPNLLATIKEYAPELFPPGVDIHFNLV